MQPRAGRRERGHWAKVLRDSRLRATGAVGTLEYGNMGHTFRTYWCPVETKNPGREFLTQGPLPATPGFVILWKTKLRTSANERDPV